MTEWLVKKGINYPRPGRPKTGPGSTDEVRQEPGAVVSDIPEAYVEGFVENGDIEDKDAAPPEAPKVTPPAKATKAPEPEEAPEPHARNQRRR